MANSYFQFKQFTVQQDVCAMKVTTDGCLFGAWCATALNATTGKEMLLDIGTGTGLLSLMIRQKNGVTIDAVEIDALAAAQAVQNVMASPWNGDIHVITNNVLHMDFSKSYDYIISNPPFYENDLQSPDLRRANAHHSRQLTLQALVHFIKKRLKLTGFFYLLLPYKRFDEMKTLLRNHELFISKEVVIRQTEQHAPFRIMLKGGWEEKHYEKTTITIADAHRHYTLEFKALLEDYYLNL